MKKGHRWGPLMKKSEQSVLYTIEWHSVIYLNSWNVERWYFPSSIYVDMVSYSLWTLASNKQHWIIMEYLVPPLNFRRNFYNEFYQKMTHFYKTTVIEGFYITAVRCHRLLSYYIPPKVHIVAFFVKLTKYYTVWKIGPIPIFICTTIINWIMYCGFWAIVRINSLFKGE